MKFRPPSNEWLLHMAELEDQCRSISAGCMTGNAIRQVLKCPDCGKLIPDDVDYSHCDCGYRVDDMCLDRSSVVQPPPIVSENTRSER